MSNILTVAQLRKMAPINSSKELTDAQYLIRSVNAINKARVQEGETIGLKPLDNLTGAVAAPIPTDADGNRVPYTLSQTPISRAKVVADELADFFTSEVEVSE